MRHVEVFILICDDEQSWATDARTSAASMADHEALGNMDGAALRGRAYLYLGVGYGTLNERFFGQEAPRQPDGQDAPPASKARDPSSGVLGEDPSIVNRAP